MKLITYDSKLIFAYEQPASLLILVFLSQFAVVQKFYGRVAMLFRMFIPGFADFL
jgi:hypothetical protein